MAWALESDRPIYLQLAEQLKLRIISGKYSPGERLPSVRELAVEASVNPNTMQRAMSELENSGLILTQRTVGRSVTEDSKVISNARNEAADTIIECLTDKMKALGFSKEAVVDYIMIKVKEKHGDE